MSSTITNPSPRRRHRRSHARRQRVAPPQPDLSAATESTSLRDRVVKCFEDAMHYAVAIVLSTIAVATMAYTTYSLVTTSKLLSTPTRFGVATSNAVAGVLIVLILVEIIRTVVTPPDSKGLAIRKLLVIAIMSALREVLWMGVNSGSPELGKPIAMAISTVVVIGLAMAFTLVRRVSGEPAS